MGYISRVRSKTAQIVDSLFAQSLLKISGECASAKVEGMVRRAVSYERKGMYAQAKEEWENAAKSSREDGQEILPVEYEGLANRANLKDQLLGSGVKKILA